MFFLVFSVCFFSISLLEAQEIPRSIINKCREEVKKANPIKITYNYGTLSVDYSKNTEEVSRDCGDKAAGCFHGKNGCYWAAGYRNIQIGEYTCSYPHADIDCNFRGVYIDLTNEYSGCKARAVLRHELQHFMIWKTARENMMKEMKVYGTDFALRNIKVCEGICHNKTYNELWENLRKIRDNLRKIRDKWYEIGNANDERLDEIDHNHDAEVGYTVCAPYSLEVNLH
ncbi:MAG: hypothetical protein IJ532_02750 [Alphaproteobacteria bacterium]|nr:hypothetical protein [Alphaproteobacteria bacterium]